MDKIGLLRAIREWRNSKGLRASLSIAEDTLAMLVDIGLVHISDAPGTTGQVQPGPKLQPEEVPH